MAIFLLLLYLCQAYDKFQVGGTVHIRQTVTQPCKTIRYSSNFKPISIKLQNDKIKQFVISTDLYQSCPDKCDLQSTYCTQGTTSTINENISVCTDDIYVYLYPDKQQKKVFTNITTDYLNTPCQGFDRDHSNFCLMLSDDDCNQFCGSTCGVLHCLYDDIKEHKLKQSFKMCLPVTTGKEERERRCKANVQFTEESWNTCHHQGSSGFSSVYIVFIVLFVVVVLSLIGIVVYYRVMYKRFGRAPFKVPKWCPVCLFPRDVTDDIHSLRVLG